LRNAKSILIGKAATVREKLEKFLDATNADELMISAMIYDQTARLRSYEIVAMFGRIKPLRAIGVIVVRA